jgi:hypothetical protein
MIDGDGKAPEKEPKNVAPAQAFTNARQERTLQPRRLL